MKRGNIWIPIMLALAVIFFIACFPIKHMSGYTCLADRLLNIEASHASSVDELVHRYIFPFGILWWSSIALISTLIYFKHLKH